MGTIEEVPAGVLSTSAPPPPPLARNMHSLPLLLHLVGENATKNAREWAAQADGFMVKAWRPEELAACRKLVGVMDDAYASVFPPADDKTTPTSDPDGLQKIPRPDAEKLLMDELLLLFLYGGVVATTAKTPRIPITFACEQYRDAIVILFALDNGARIETSLMMSAARVRAFETLFGIIARGRVGQLESIIKEFFRSAIQSSPAHTIRVIDSSALQLLYGEVSTAPSEAAGASKLPPLEVLTFYGATPQTMGLFVGKSAMAIGKATHLSDAVIGMTLCPEASNASVADMIVIDDALFDSAKALQSSLNMATMFQQAAAVARPGTTIVVARHGVIGDAPEKDANFADALIVPQLKIMQAVKLAEDAAFGVWKL